MRTLRWLFLLPPVILAAGCGRSDDLEHRVRHYDVVEEGSAAGVTTALGGDAGSVPSLTDTNVDTTTDLTLLPGAADTGPGDAVGQAAPGSLAETLRVGAAAPARGTPPGDVHRQPAEAPAARREPTSTAPTPARPARETTPPARPAEPASKTPQPARAAPPPPAEEPPEEIPPPPTTTQPEEPPPRTTTQPEEPPPRTTTQPEEPPPEDPPPTNTAPPPEETRDGVTRETDEGGPFLRVL
jgi:hypothetical protein